MKFALVSLILCLGVASASAGLVSNRDAAGHNLKLKERLGHFKQAPFYFDLYKTYVTTFITGQGHEKRAQDDYRNTRPSGEECHTFFGRFRVNDYKIAELEDLVILDACLGYLYEEEPEAHTEDDLELIGDNKLKALYDGSRVEELPEEAKICVANTLYNNFLGRGQFKVQCNNHMIQLFLQFAECHQTIPEDQRDTDTYLKIIYDFIKSRGQECFYNEINLLNKAVRENYDSNPFARLEHSIRENFNGLSAQMKERMWPSEFKNLFKAVQKTGGEINLNYIHQLVRGVMLNDERFIEQLLSHMAVYATNKLNAPQGAKKIFTFGKSQGNKKLAKDSSGGSNTYERYVDELCNYFRASDNKKNYDFATALTRMVRMIAHEEIFGISEKTFVANVLTNSFETGALYLAISSCNILTFTEGFVQRQAANGPPQFKVTFKKDTSSMLRWPDAGFY